MSFIQKITPTPVIRAEEGMCLQYVRMAFGLPARYGSATEAWNASTSKHRDRNFPAGVWHPIHYGLASNVNGHIVLRAPDGRVYSTSDRNPSPLHVHPNVAALEAYYAYYGVPLTYRGWTEDVASTPVIAPAPAPRPVAKPAPAPAGVKILTVTAPVAMVRTSPNVGNNVARAYPTGLARGAKVAAIGYVAGQDPIPGDGKLDNAWIKTKSGYFIWANNLGNSLAGLKKLN